MGDKIIRMTQDLLDRGNNTCFERNKKTIKNNNTDPRKKEENIMNRDPYTLFYESGPKGIMLHSTRASLNSAQANVNLKNRKKEGKDVEDAVHAFIGPGEVVQCLPWGFRGVHGGIFDDTHLGIEMSQPDTIKFVEKEDGSIIMAFKEEAKENKAKWKDTENFALESYHTAVKLCAFLCNQYGFKPREKLDIKASNSTAIFKVPVITSHQEAYHIAEGKVGNRYKRNSGISQDLWGNILFDIEKDNVRLAINLTMEKFREEVEKALANTKMFFVADRWNSEITLGKKPGAEIKYKANEKVGGKIERNYPVALGKIDTDKACMTLPSIDPETKQYLDFDPFPETYPLYNPGYRIACNCKDAAAVAAVIAHRAEKYVSKEAKQYRVFNYEGDVAYRHDIIASKFLYGVKLPVNLTDIGLAVSSLTVTVTPSGGRRADTYTFTAITTLPASKVVLELNGDSKEYNMTAHSDKKISNKRIWTWRSNSLSFGDRTATAYIYYNGKKLIGDKAASVLFTVKYKSAGLDINGFDSAAFWDERREAGWISPIRYSQGQLDASHRFGYQRPSGRIHAGIDFPFITNYLEYYKENKADKNKSEPPVDKKALDVLERFSRKHKVCAMANGTILSANDTDFFFETGDIVIEHGETIVRYCEVGLAPGIEKLIGIKNGINKGDVIGYLKIHLGQYPFNGKQKDEKRPETTCNGGHMLHLEVYRGSIKENRVVLSVKSNPNNYRYVVTRNYLRRADLIDPTCARNLPRMEITKPINSVETIERMLENLEKDATVSYSSSIKKKTIIGIGRTMLEEGYHPAFVAGMLANIFHEGSAGIFEGSNYDSRPQDKPAYLEYMDKNHNYRAEYSRQRIMDKSLSKVYKLLKELESKKWVGKFGLGCVQWTGGRSKTLVEIYMKEANGKDNITLDQVLKAEGLMISRELGVGGRNPNIYGDWLYSNYDNLNSEEAAFGAGETLCRLYEVPKERFRKGPVRAETAEKIYNVMALNGS